MQVAHVNACDTGTNACMHEVKQPSHVDASCRQSQNHSVSLLWVALWGLT